MNSAKLAQIVGENGFMSRRTNWIFLAAIIAVSFVAGSGLWKIFAEPDAPVTQPVSGTGAAAIGGPFALTDHHGVRTDEAGLLGHYTLVYFGYTYCPDICPTELQVIGTALDLLTAQAPDRISQVQAYFITVDPRRDDQAALAEYVPHFHPKLVGLTGSPDDIAGAARAYRVYYAQVASDDETNVESDDMYFMDHSNIIYLMGPDGKYLAHFGYGTSPEEIAGKLNELLG